MDRLIAALLRCLPDRLLEAVNALSFNALDQRGLIVWRGAEARTQWRYFTVRRNTLPAQAAVETTTTTRAGGLPTSILVLLATTLALLLGSWLGSALGGFECPTIDLQLAPRRPSDILDFSVPSDHENPSPQPTKPQPTNKPTRPKPVTRPSPH